MSEGDDLRTTIESLQQENQVLRSQAKELQESRSCLALDLTEQVNAERALKRSEERYRTLFEQSREMIVITDRDGKIIDVNHSVLAALGYTRDEMLNMGYRDLLCSLAREVDFFRELEQQGYVQDFEDQIRKKDGSPIDCLLTVAEVADDDGRIQLCQGILHDITERRQSERKLREQEQQYREIVNSTLDGLIILDLNGNVVEANPQACELFGYSRSEFFALAGKDLVHPAFYKNEGGFLDQISTSGRFLAESINVRKDGTCFYAEAKGVEFDYRGRKHLLAVVRDVTKRKRAEDALKKSEELYRMLAENVHDVIWTIDIGLVFTYISPSIVDLCGYRAEEIIGRSVDTLVTKRSRAKARALFKRVARGFLEDSPVVELELNGNDAPTICGEVRVSCLRDGSGKPTGLLGVVRDISERKKAEVRINNLTRQLIKTQENERRRLSRDLHDNIAQTLSALRLECDILFQTSFNNIPSAEKVQTFTDRLDGTITEVRNIAYDLRPPMLDEFGLAKTVFRYCSEFAETYGIAVEFYSAGLENFKLPSDIEINIFRLVQEALSNVRKHAAATKLSVRMVASFPILIIRIDDNGKGFNVEERLKSLQEEKRMGLKNMQERVALFNGTMRIRSRPSIGTQIYAEMPIGRIG